MPVGPFHLHCAGETSGPPVSDTRPNERRQSFDSSGPPPQTGQVLPRSSTLLSRRLCRIVPIEPHRIEDSLEALATSSRGNACRPSIGFVSLSSDPWNPRASCYTGRWSSLTATLRQVWSPTKRVNSLFSIYHLWSSDGFEKGNSHVWPRISKLGHDPILTYRSLRVGNFNTRIRQLCLQTT